MTEGLAFDAILNFLGDLAEAFPNSSAEKYFSFIKNIRVSDKKEQEKHVKLFSAFCVANRTEILDGKLDGFELHKICFDDSEDPFDIQEVFSHKDFKDNEDDILKHMLTISAIVDNESGAKQILASMEKNSLFQDSSIANLFGQITKDIESKADVDNPDPMSTIEQIIKADSFKKLVSTIVSKAKSGEVDLGNLITGMSSVGKLMEGMPKTG